MVGNYTCLCMIQSQQLSRGRENSCPTASNKKQSLFCIVYSFVFCWTFWKDIWCYKWKPYLNTNLLSRCYYLSWRSLRQVSRGPVVAEREGETCENKPIFSRVFPFSCDDPQGGRSARRRGRRKSKLLVFWSLSVVSLWDWLRLRLQINWNGEFCILKSLSGHIFSRWYCSLSRWVKYLRDKYMNENTMISGERRVAQMRV